MSTYVGALEGDEKVANERIELLIEAGASLNGAASGDDGQRTTSGRGVGQKRRDEPSKNEPALPRRAKKGASLGPPGR